MLADFGMLKFSFVCILTSTITEHITEADSMPVEIDHPTTDQSDIQLEPGVLIQKKAKKARSRRKKSTTSEGHSFSLLVYPYIDFYVCIYPVYIVLVIFLICHN